MLARTMRVGDVACVRNSQGEAVLWKITRIDGNRVIVAIAAPKDSDVSFHKEDMDGTRDSSARGGGDRG